MTQSKSVEPDAGGVEAIPWRGALRLVVEASAGEGGAEAAVEACWERMRRACPRLYNGPILGVTALEEGEIRARREEYRRLCVQPEVPTGVELLSVTGVVRARGVDGREVVLLGRRGAETRIYAGEWELGPSGGIDPPAGPEGAVLGLEDVVEQVRRELREEAGIEATLTRARVRWLTRDPVAHSLDVVVECWAEGVRGTAERTWEYSEVAWVAVEELASWAGRLIPPSRVLLPRVMGGS